jgi:predicted ester cyclase
MSTADDNKVLVQRFWLGVFNDRNLALVDQMLSDTYTFNGYHNTKAQVKAFAQSIWTNFPDVHFTILDMVAEGDKVALRYTVEGTAAGTTQKFSAMATNIVTVTNGLGVSNWQTGGKMEPVGAPPAAGKGPAT